MLVKQYGAEDGLLLYLSRLLSRSGLKGFDPFAIALGNTGPRLGRLQVARTSLDAAEVDDWA